MRGNKCPNYLEEKNQMDFLIDCMWGARRESRMQPHFKPGRTDVQFTEMII